MSNERKTAAEGWTGNVVSPATVIGFQRSAPEVQPSSNADILTRSGRDPVLSGRWRTAREDAWVNRGGTSSIERWSIGSDSMDRPRRTTAVAGDLRRRVRGRQWHTLWLPDDTAQPPSGAGVSVLDGSSAIVCRRSEAIRWLRTSLHRCCLDCCRSFRSRRRRRRRISKRRPQPSTRLQTARNRLPQNKAARTVLKALNCSSSTGKPDTPLLRECHRYNSNNSDKIAFQSKVDHPLTRQRHAFLLMWPWPKYDDLDLRVWPRYFKDALACTKNERSTSRQLKFRTPTRLQDTPLLLLCDAGLNTTTLTYELSRYEDVHEYKKWSFEMKAFKR